MKRDIFGIELDFVIDGLTNSIRNTHTGDSFLTEVSRLTHKDLWRRCGEFSCIRL